MAYILTPEQVDSIDEVDRAFSTMALLPPWDEIPEEFKRDNPYSDVAERVFYGMPLPGLRIEMKPGFQAPSMVRAVRAHLASWGPKHEHKIAGVGYMLSLMCSLTQDRN